MKKILIGIGVFLIGMASLCALTHGFWIDSSKLSLTTHSKQDTILSHFKDTYQLSYAIGVEDEAFHTKITALAKKTTYLLLGDFNNVKESSEEYYKRHQDYLQLRYNPVVPKDEFTLTGLDQNSQEYKDDLISGITVPQIFNSINELGILYKSFGDIRISKTNDIVLASVLLKDVSLKEQSKEDPMRYDRVKTNLILYYYYKELNGEYKLYYLYGETTEDLSNYVSMLENEEKKESMQMASTYESKLKEVYDFSKLEVLSDTELNSIYNTNAHNIVFLNSYYNNYVVSSAHGFFINKGLVLTTWDFLEKSLIEAQYMVIKDHNGNTYIIDGIVTANPETDIVVIKLKEQTNNEVILGNSELLKVEDPLITISSKTGSGLTLQKGIVIASDGYVQSSIPLQSSDGGSPLWNKEGKVVGMNTAKQVSTSTSLAIGVEALKEIQDKFSTIDFQSIETVSFNKLKEKFYYVKYNKEIIKNNISDKYWKTYSRIGKIEESIRLNLVKASYKDGIVSLRYDNEISNYISSMQLALPFKEELLKEGYKETLKGNKKCIYENKKYQIIIMDEFNDLIVVMVKK